MNLHHPARYETETFEQYKVRRAQSNAVAKEHVAPALTVVFEHRYNADRIRMNKSQRRAAKKEKRTAEH